MHQPLGRGGKGAPSERPLRLVDAQNVGRGPGAPGDDLAALAKSHRIEELEAELGALLGGRVRLVLMRAESTEPTARAPRAAAVGLAAVCAADVDVANQGDSEPDAAPTSGWVMRPAGHRPLGARLSAVAELLLEGRCDKEIAARLGVQHATARTYVQRLCRQLGVSGRGGVVRLAAAGQLILAAKTPTATR